MDRCAHQNFNCLRARYRSYKYCFQHMDKDDSSPCTTCSYMSNHTGKRCLNPAVKMDRSNKEVFCDLHSGSWLNNARKRGANANSSEEDDSLIPDNCISKYNSAFCDAKVKDPRNPLWNPKISKFLPFNDIAHDHDLDENFSFPFTTFDICTKEELVGQHGQLINHLITLYEKQQKYYHNKYLESTKEHKKAVNEFDVYMRQHNQPIPEHMKALKSYHACSGQELILSRKAKRRKLGYTEEIRDARTQICSFVSILDVQCRETVLPGLSCCLDHMECTGVEKLYVVCSVCNRAVNKFQLQNATSTYFCRLHMKLSPVDTKVDAYLKEIEAEDIETVKSTVKDLVNVTDMLMQVVDTEENPMEDVAHDKTPACIEELVPSLDTTESSKEENVIAGGSLDTLKNIKESNEKQIVDAEGSLDVPKNSEDNKEENVIEEGSLDTTKTLKNESKEENSPHASEEPSKKKSDVEIKKNEAVIGTTSKFSDFANQKTFLLSSCEPGSILMQPLQECSLPNLLVPVTSEKTKVCPASYEHQEESFFKNYDEGKSTLTSSSFNSAVLSVEKSHKDFEVTRGSGRKHVTTSGTMIPPYESPPRFEDSDDDNCSLTQLLFRISPNTSKITTEESEKNGSVLTETTQVVSKSDENKNVRTAPVPCPNKDMMAEKTTEDLHSNHDNLKSEPKKVDEECLKLCAEMIENVESMVEDNSSATEASNLNPSSVTDSSTKSSDDTSSDPGLPDENMECSYQTNSSEERW